MPTRILVAYASRTGSTVEVAETIGHTLPAGGAPVRAMVKPLGEALFAGKLDFRKMPFNKHTLMFRLSVAFGVLPRGDRRDWQAVRAWAEALTPVLQ